MKHLSAIIICILAFYTSGVRAEKHASSDRYGHTLNVGIGIGGYSGYYNYVGQSLPVLNANYEFTVANNFTLAPFISFYNYSNSYYHESVIPIGVKGSYYFDDILKASHNWDFYLAGSLGTAIVNSTWDNNYNGNRNYYHNGNPLLLDIHIGTEYHLTRNLGIFLDLSSGVSTLGLSFH
ncbi:MAG: hypothetical protein PHV20_01705 [Bacteroidales bacterium]|nr:hypothetical protein [Bacteroidales bacterium]